MKNDKKEAAKAIAASRQAVLDAEQALREQKATHDDAVGKNKLLLLEFCRQQSEVRDKFVCECVMADRQARELLRTIVVKVETGKEGRYEYWKPFYSITIPNNQLPGVAGIVTQDKMMLAYDLEDEKLAEKVDNHVLSEPEFCQTLIKFPHNRHQEVGAFLSHALITMLAFYYDRSDCEEPIKKLEDAIPKAKDFIERNSSCFTEKFAGEVFELMFLEAYGEE